MILPLLSIGAPPYSYIFSTLPSPHLSSPYNLPSTNLTSEFLPQQPHITRGSIYNPLSHIKRHIQQDTGNKEPTLCLHSHCGQESTFKPRIPSITSKNKEEECDPRNASRIQAPGRLLVIIQRPHQIQTKAMITLAAARLRTHRTVGGTAMSQSRNCPVRRETRC